MNIILIGCGRVGAGLAQLLQRQGHAVTVVDQDPLAFERLGPAFKGRQVTGLGFDQKVLQEAGISRADGLAAVTASDEANLVIAQLGRQVFRVPCVVARAYDPRKAEIFRRLGIQTISPVSLGVARMAELLSFASMDSVATLGAGELDIVNITLPSGLNDHRVSDLNVPNEIQVVGITRNGHTFLPIASTVFKDGDQVHLSVMVTAAERLRGMLS